MVFEATIDGRYGGPSPARVWEPRGRTEDGNSAKPERPKGTWRPDRPRTVNNETDLWQCTCASNHHAVHIKDLNILLTIPQLSWGPGEKRTWFQVSLDPGWGREERKKETNILWKSGYMLGQVQCTSQEGRLCKTRLGAEPRTGLAQSGFKRRKPKRWAKRTRQMQTNSADQRYQFWSGNMIR